MKLWIYVYTLRIYEKPPIIGLDKKRTPEMALEILENVAGNRKLLCRPIQDNGVLMKIFNQSAKDNNLRAMYCAFRTKIKQTLEILIETDA